MSQLRRKTIRKILLEPGNLKLIKNELDINPNHTMTSLARYMCKTLEFVSPAGKLQTAACRVVLQSFAATKKIILPASKKPRSMTYTPMVRLHAPVALPQQIPASVREIKDKLAIVLVGENDTANRKIWNELIATEHPLGETRLAGYQIKYLIMYEDGYIGAASFSSSALNLECRDKWINWNIEQKDEYQSRVLNMSRFLIRDAVKCKYLASHLLSVLLKRFKTDYQLRYGLKPWLVETFVDTTCYKGTCYKAANWLLLGQTKGRGRNDRYALKQKSRKDIYVYVLEKEFRSIATITEPEDPYAPMAITTGIESAVWADQEFGEIELGDKRLSDRVVKIAYDKGNSPTCSYPKAVNGDRYAIKGYYGFLSNTNEEITFEQLLCKHRKSTIQRIKGCNEVIAIQDTCDLSYPGLKKTKGLGMVAQQKKGGSGTPGLALHSTFAVNSEGIPLGIMNAQCDANSFDGLTNKERIRLPVEKKESYKWIVHYRKTLEIADLCPETQIISVMDREADFFELHEIVCADRNKVPVVIRAQYDRRITNSSIKLFEYMRKEHSGEFNLKVLIPAQRAKPKTKKKPERPYVPAREATLCVSYGTVTIPPPKKPLLKNKDPLNINFVYARELCPPEGCEKIEWKLLTTLDIKSNKAATKCIKYYKLRWRIEEFHRVLKSGCGVEKHKQDHADKLRRVIALDLVIAWRIMLLALLGREIPDMPAEIVFSKLELFSLHLLQKKRPATFDDERCRGNNCFVGRL